MMASRIKPAINDNARPDRALELLYLRYRDAVRRYVEMMFGSGPPDPEDAVQAAFEAFARIEDRDMVQNPHAFLIRSARNYVIDRHRRYAVRRRFSDSSRHIAETSDPCDAERVLSGKQQWTILEHAIATLDDRHRDALILNRIEGMSCARIAELQGVSATTVKTLIAQALIVCDRALREAGGGDD